MWFPPWIYQDRLCAVRSTGRLFEPWLLMNGVKILDEIICKTPSSLKLLNVSDIRGEKS